jgi:hypothetical protein
MTGEENSLAGERERESAKEIFKQNRTNTNSVAFCKDMSKEWPDANLQAGPLIVRP